MRKLFYLGFCLVLAMGVGCAITDYELMFDSYSGEVINTNGKADIIPSSQVALIWSDGADNLFSMVDQKANGDRTLTTYNFFTTDGTYFQDYTYCSPDWTGCAIWTAPDPEVGDVDPFDGAWNQNCSGSRSLSSLVGTLRYYGECGRVSFDVQERIAALSSFSGTGYDLYMNLNHGNSTVTLNGAGQKHLVPFLGNVGVRYDLAANNIGLDMTNPLVAASFRAAADIADRYAVDSATFMVNGIEKTVSMKLRPEAMRSH